MSDNEQGKTANKDEKWREELDPEQYHVLREKGTERFSDRDDGTSFYAE